MLTAALLLLLGSTPASAGPDEGGAQCIADSTCPYSCCRKRNPKAPCYCSACCVGATAGDAGEIFWNGDRLAILKARVVEFYRLPGGVKAYVGESSATAKALESAILPRGRVFFRSGQAELVLKAAAARVFSGDLLPAGHPSGRREAFILCARDAKEFCGAVNLKGKELFRLESRSAGSEIEPLGLSPDGSEALFGVISSLPRRETIGYVARFEGKAPRPVALDDPGARRLLKRFQGDAVLPEP